MLRWYHFPPREVMAKPAHTSSACYSTRMAGPNPSSDKLWEEMQCCRDSVPQGPHSRYLLLLLLPSPPADRRGGLRNGLVTATTASLHHDGAEKSKCIPGVWQGPGGAAAGETAHAHRYRELLQENPKLLLVRAKTSPCDYLPMASSDMTSTAVEKRSMLFCTTMPSMASPV